jgi:hypothetical protein
MLTLRARPLRFEITQYLVPLAVLPGLALAAAHAPVALLALGPLVMASWVLSQRDRHRLDRCVVEVDGPALVLRYRGQLIDGVDLRFASRQVTPREDLVLSEGEAGFLAFGTDPPDNAYPPAGDGGQPEPPLGFWRAVRLLPADLQRLRAAVDAVPPEPPPDPERPQDLLRALGSVGPWGPRAEEALAARLRHHADPDRPAGLDLQIQELALREGPVGAAARRILRALRR